MVEVDLQWDMSSRRIDAVVESRAGQTLTLKCPAAILSVEARRQFPDGYRGEEIDKYTAMTFMTFLANWSEKLSFYGGNWNGKHNNGVPLYMPDLMLDLPVMRASTVYNWREGPILTRGKDGTIRRNKVIYQTKGFPFGG